MTTTLMFYRIGDIFRYTFKENFNFYINVILGCSGVNTYKGFLNFYSRVPFLTYEYKQHRNPPLTLLHSVSNISWSIHPTCVDLWITFCTPDMNL